MKILLAAFKQETSSFNPARTPYDMFNVLFGDELLALRAAIPKSLARSTSLPNARTST